MLIDVALPLPLFRQFTYEVDTPLPAGARVVVPLRGSRLIGICLGAHQGAVSFAPRKVLDIPDAEPALAPQMLSLCQWIAEYYVVPLGLVVRSALPAALLGADTPRPAPKIQRMARIARDLPSLIERDAVFARAKRQREVFESIETLGNRAPVTHLVKQLGVSPSVLRALAKRGLIEIDEDVVERDPFAARPVDAARHAPTAAQAAAVAALSAGKPGEVFLLHGVTGSGKTLVYVEFLRHVIETRGQTAIVLVPEIALTPQTVDRFRAAFGDRVAVLHSALSDGERSDAWHALKSGRKRIAVGARSAVFAPLNNLGAIIVDEEHEGTYKQGESPRYHAREVAIVRARLEGAVTVLGSATPSLESWSNASTGKYHLLSLPDRVGGGRLPSVAVLDLRRPPDTPAPSPLLPPLEKALSETLERGEQSILLLNRRGYAAFVQCGACGDVAVCPNCSISLTDHRTPPRLVCHYCLHEEPPRETCLRCGGKTLRRRGLGTQQVERLLAERFPSARIARMDVDTTTGKWAHAEILDRVGRGEVDMLLGTQMIAKGLDFPNVTLVGVIDADVGINLPDFRASERCFQLLSQVAGRAGRAQKPGRVLIQTRLPTHHAVRYAVAHDYASFVREELCGRQAPPYPPTIRLANIVFSGTDEQSTSRFAEESTAWLARLPAEVSIVGPAPCPVERIKGRWRWHVVLKAEQPAELSRVGRYFMRRIKPPAAGQLRVTFDRDPVALL
ncbi:MAG TPA: primosomal protein N' [Gemmatimonadaceae bacterium]|nr:primosomal protein N' [Gemmatimonadaceae bacterium]